MYHFIYKTICKSGKYYIGRHSTNNLDDGYFGSGKWIRSLKDKSTLTREILLFCDESELKNHERMLLEQNVGKENCMNFNINPVGFSSGVLNPSHREDIKKKSSERFSGEKNPSKRPEVRKKMSDSQKGRINPNKGKPMSEQGKKNISEGRKGLKISDEGRKKLSDARKEEYASGRRIPWQTIRKLKFEDNTQ